MTSHLATLRLMPALLALLLCCAGGCVPATNGDDTTGGSTDGSGGDTVQGATDTDDTTQTAQYTPGEELTLTNGSVSIIVPAESCDEAFTLSLRPLAASDITVDAPGDANLAGGVFGPDGQTFNPAARVTVQLSDETPLTTLPLLVLNDAGTQWVGAAANATVTGGTQATFPVRHFSTYALPQVPVPTAGDPVSSFVVISNDGSFNSNTISGNTASLTYSEFGDTFGLSVTSQEVGDSGQLETKSLGLNAVSVTSAGNLVVGICAGGRSIYNDGSFNESCYGVMILSVSGSSVTVTVYVATPERVIYGSLTGQSL